MNFQEKLLESTAGLRDCAQAFATSAMGNARARTKGAARHVDQLKGSIAALNTAGREFNKVARRHAMRFVKQNSTLATQVRDDVSALARATLASLAKSVAASKPRKPAAASTRTRKAAKGR